MARRSLASTLLAPLIALLGLALLIAAGAILRWREPAGGRLVWLAALIAILAIRTPHSLRNRENAIVDSRNDRTEKALLTAVCLAGLVLPLVLVTTPLLAFADYDLPAWATAVAAAVQLPLLWLFWRAHTHLAGNWSPGLEVREDHGLVTHGIYTHIRHPMYAALWLWALSQPLLLHNWIAGALGIPAFAAMYVVRTPREEAMMHDHFGAAWDAYAARTGRLLPRLRQDDRRRQD